VVNERNHYWKRMVKPKQTVGKWKEGPIEHQPRDSLPPGTSGEKIII